MDVFRFRSRARVVAIVDLILSSMSLCLTMILVLGAVIFSTSPIDWGNTLDDDDEDVNMVTLRHNEKMKPVIVSIVWTVVIFSGVTTIVEIVAAIKLLNATQMGQEPVGAMRLCIFWRRVCITFTVLIVLGDIFFFQFHKAATPLLSIIQILLRVAAIYIVTQFIKELERAVKTGSLPVHCAAGTGGGAPTVTGVAYSYIPPQQQQQQNQYQQQPPYNPDFNAAPPNYYDVVKDPPKLNEPSSSGLPNPGIPVP